MTKRFRMGSDLHIRSQASGEIVDSISFPNSDAAPLWCCSLSQKECDWTPPPRTAASQDSRSNLSFVLMWKRNVCRWSGSKLLPPTARATLGHFPSPPLLVVVHYRALILPGQLQFPAVVAGWRRSGATLLWGTRTDQPGRRSAVGRRDRPLRWPIFSFLRVSEPPISEQAKVMHALANANAESNRFKSDRSLGMSRACAPIWRVLGIPEI